MKEQTLNRQIKQASMGQNAVWIIDNDLDDQEFVEHVWSDLNLENELKFFRNQEELFNEIERSSDLPFIIICDIHLDTNTDGLALRKHMLDKHSKKYQSVPFIFWSNIASDTTITEAYELSIHGFFFKDHSLSELKETFSSIFSYWQRSKMPPKKVS